MDSRKGVITSMAMRSLYVLVAPGVFLAVACLAVACQPGDASTVAGDAAVTPPGVEATLTARATPTPAPPTATAVPAATSSGDGAADAGQAESVDAATVDAGAADAEAADAAVIFVHAAEAPDGSWTFRVTVSHPDTGWDDYADGWDVLTPDATVLKPNPDDAFTRVLLHPHENEQPFTRSQRGIVIPEGVTTVTVRAHDSVHGFGGREVHVDLETDSGPDFEVERQP